MTSLELDYRNKILQGDALNQMKQLADETVDWGFTSPPYLALRDYGIEGQIGLESSHLEYLKRLWEIFDEFKRVLKKTGTLWVNLGDTFAGTKVGNTNGSQGRVVQKHGINDMEFRKKTPEFQDKCLMQIPERFSIGMVDRGWILRAKIVWFKPNGMIESSKDRPKLDYEFLYMFSKSQKYWFNYIEAKKPLKSVTVKRNQYGIGEMGRLDGTNSAKHGVGKKKFAPPIGGIRAVGENGNTAYSGNPWEVPHDGMAKIGSVWGLPPESIWSIAPKTFGHEYCETCDKLIKSRDLIFKCKECQTVYSKLNPSDVLKKNNLDPDTTCLACGRTLKRHLTLNGKGRIEGLQPEVIDCGYFDLPDLQVEGCPQCKSNKRDLVCPDCKSKVHMHFAMFPEELVIPALKMSCPDQVCIKCGKPRFPIYTPTEEYAKYLGKAWHNHENDEQAGQMQEKDLPTATADYRISGWTDCGCERYQCRNCKEYISFDALNKTTSANGQAKTKRIQDSVANIKIQEGKGAGQDLARNSKLQTKELCDVRQDILWQKGADVMLKKVRNTETSQGRQTQQLESEGRKKSSMEGRLSESVGWLCDEKSLESSVCSEGRLCDGASVSDGSIFGEISIADRGCPPQEREQDGQSNRELGNNDTQQSSRRGNLPSLSENVQSTLICCHCNSTDIEKQHPGYRAGLGMDMFSGFNTVGASLLKHGRAFLNIELDPRNVRAGLKRVEPMLKVAKMENFFG